jgi:lipopolysaccharide export system permease protein
VVADQPGMRVAREMGSIGRYIFRTTLGVFLLVLVSLTLLIWITQALRDIDLMTNQGQNILVFVGITGLLVPLLVLIIAPLAFMVAMAYVLNKLSTDSELIVMNAAGMPPWYLFRPFLAVAALVALLQIVLAAYLSPKGLRVLRQWATEVRTDLVTNIVHAGRFTSLEGGQLTLYIRERPPNGQLLGLLIDDQRHPKERSTFLAEQGEILKNDRGTYLLLANGSVQRHEAGERDPKIVLFDRYAFDLSQLAKGSQNLKYPARERYLWELFNPKEDDLLYAEQPDQVRAELHDRIIALLYPLAIAVLMFAYLGAPRTTRQSRNVSLLAAIGSVLVLRVAGFFGTLAGPHMPAALIIPYATLAAAFVLGYRWISSGLIIEPPAFITYSIAAFAARLAERSGRVPGQPR